MPKVDNFATFWKPKACGQTVLPDKLISIGQNCWKIPMFKNSNETFWVILKQCALASHLFWQFNFPRNVSIINGKCLITIHSGTELTYRATNYLRKIHVIYFSFGSILKFTTRNVNIFGHLWGMPSCILELKLFPANFLASGLLGLEGSAIWPDSMHLYARLHIIHFLDFTHLRPRSFWGRRFDLPCIFGFQLLLGPDIFFRWLRPGSRNSSLCCMLQYKSESDS